MKKLWQSTVELVIGMLVNFLSMGRVNTRGIKLAVKRMLMTAVCYNLKLLLKWIGKGSQNTEKSLAKFFSVL